jgi:hypothetical protein
MEKKFRKVVVIFIDILGSQTRINFDEWYNVISVFSRMVEREKELDNNHPWTVYKREIHVFSDCAYIIYDYKDDIEDSRKDMYELMGIACYNTEKVLYEFLKNGFIARGAITYGDLFYDNEKNIWFGPAMNRAYFLESKLAIFPRIIIDPEYAEKLFEFNETKYRMSTEQKMVNGEILYRDMDDFVYLNYLNSGKSGMNQMEYMNVIEAALRLCDIERNKTRKTEEIQKSIKNKYDWLEKYLLTTNNRL